MTPIKDFVDALEKAARNGTKAHIPCEVARAALTSSAWQHFLAERQQEIVAEWAQQPLPPAPSLAPSGSTGVPSESSGSSRGMTTEVPVEVVESAVRRRALANMAAMENPRKQRKTL